MVSIDSIELSTLFLVGNGVGLPESLIWTYVVQLSSALRSIHAAGMAARTMDPSKILVVGKSKYVPLFDDKTIRSSRVMINCCGIVDVFTSDMSSSNSNAITHIHNQQVRRYDVFLIDYCLLF